jgi:hypothetical protein
MLPDTLTITERIAAAKRLLSYPEDRGDYFFPAGGSMTYAEAAEALARRIFKPEDG